MRYVGVGCCCLWMLLTSVQWVMVRGRVRLRTWVVRLLEFLVCSLVTVLVMLFGEWPRSSPVPVLMWVTGSLMLMTVCSTWLWVLVLNLVTLNLRALSRAVMVLRA